MVQPALCFLRATQQHQRASTVSLRAGLFRAHSVLGKHGSHTFVDRERFRRQIEFEIRVSDLVFGKDGLNRQTKRRVALSRALEIVECAIVTTLQERKQTDVAFDSRQRHGLFGCFGLS